MSLLLNSVFAEDVFFKSVPFPGAANNFVIVNKAVVPPKSGLLLMFISSFTSSSVKFTSSHSSRRLLKVTSCIYGA